MKKILWLMILLFSACVPAATAPSPDVTSGAAVVVTGDTYRNDVFSVAYPSGWRVITSPAGAPPSVTFAAPGDCPLIVVSSAPLEQPPACADPDARAETRTITRGEHTFTLAGSATAALWDAYLAAADRIASSLTLTP